MWHLVRPEKNILCDKRRSMQTLALLTSKSASSLLVLLHSKRTSTDYTDSHSRHSPQLSSNKVALIHLLRLQYETEIPGGFDPSHHHDYESKRRRCGSASSASQPYGPYDSCAANNFFRTVGLELCKAFFAQPCPEAIQQRKTQSLQVRQCLHESIK